MLLQLTNTLPDSPDYLYEVKWDGYRALAIKSGESVTLRSRNANDFTRRYPTIISALASLPDETVLDGEVVALDESGRPSFTKLQNYRSLSGVPLLFYVFDILMLAGRDLTGEPLSARRKLLEKRIVPELAVPLRYSYELSGSLPVLVDAIREHGLEGLVAKRRNSRYEPGQKSGAWKKMRLNTQQEFVIGGYTPLGNSFDALIFGYYEGGHLRYVARTRNGFTSASRLQVFKRLKPLETLECPFTNLPEKRAVRRGLTPAKMASCRWLKPELVGQFQFREWTPDNHLRQSSFVALRDDKKPLDVVRES